MITGLCQKAGCKAPATHYPLIRVPMFNRPAKDPFLSDFALSVAGCLAHVSDGCQAFIDCVPKAGRLAMNAKLDRAGLKCVDWSRAIVEPRPIDGSAHVVYDGVRVTTLPQVFRSV